MARISWLLGRTTNIPRHPTEGHMVRLASMLFGLIGTTLAGIAIAIVVATPSLADRGMSLIPIAAAIGLALGAPVSLIVARAILLNARRST